MRWRNENERILLVQSSEDHKPSLGVSLSWTNDRPGWLYTCSAAQAVINFEQRARRLGQTNVRM